MANLFDYIEKYGKTKIGRNVPLNVVDAMAFARYAYLPLNNLLSSTRDVRFFNDDKKLMTAMAKAPRYRDLEISDYEREFDAEIDEQFAALCIHLSEKEMVVAYMGTDDSLNGWKEDFNMAFMEEVPSQKQARKYLARIAEKYPEKKLRIVGHSKGGTLAMTAALTAKSKVAKRIVAVVSFDGPGLSEKLTKKHRKSAQLVKIINYVPEHSIAGRLFLHTEKCQVVKSSKEAPYYQHNLYYWMVDVEKRKLVPATRSQRSLATERMINKWLEGVPKNRRQNFVNAMFKVIELSDYDNPAEIAYKGGAALPNVLASYWKLDKAERKTVFRGVKKLLKVAIAERKQEKK